MGFELNVNIEELAKSRKLFIATPMYGGMNAGMYTRSMIELVNMLTRMGIPHVPYFLFNESLITRARNYCCDVFMRSDCTHMIFIDSDIGFNPNDVIALLAMQDDDSEYDIIGGPYPKKCISWEKIKTAVDKGFADEDPNQLENFVGDFVFNPKSGSERIAIGEPAEVLEIGTGFMMVRRKTLEIMNEKMPHLLYRPDHIRTADFDGSREIMMYFQAEIDSPTADQQLMPLMKQIAEGSVDDPEQEMQEALVAYEDMRNKSSKRYLSEDYWFCAHSQTQIETPEGTRTIKNIVDTKYSGPVLSVDADGNCVWRNVINWWSKPNGKRGRPETKKTWVTFDTDCDNNTKSKPKVTSDHRVSYFDDLFNPQIKYIEAKNMTNKFSIRKPQRTENPLYSTDQISMLVGTLLGDSSIGKQGQLTCQHSDTQKDYIELKAKIFGGKFSGPVKQNGFGEGKFKYVMHAPINAHTRKFRELMYRDGIKRIDKIIDMIDEKSLAFWYMDDGCLHPDGAVYLATNGFTFEENDLIKQKMKERFDLDVSVDTKRVKYDGVVREYPSLRMKNKSSKKFFDLIARYIPSFMKYKLPTTHHNLNDVFDYSSVKFLDFAASYVNKVRELPKLSSRLYDIEVEDTHNFFASGTLVHNCQKVQEIGLKTWLCPWMKMNHVGTYVFGGSLADLANLGVSATACAETIKANREKAKKV